MKEDLKIKLNQLNKAELREKEMNRLLGGVNGCCLCGCEYSDISSHVANFHANTEKALSSPGGSGYTHGDAY